MIAEREWAAGSAGKLLARLRDETRERHELLDATVGSEVARSKTSYERFLTSSLVAVRSLEPRIEKALGPDFLAQRAVLLAADLHALTGGHATGATAQAQLEQPAAEPITEAAAFGFAYVVEGSALGGLVLAERVRQRLGAQTATAYLTHRGAATAARWRWFLERLDTFAAQAGASVHAEASSAAAEAFDLYIRAFA